MHRMTPFLLFCKTALLEKRGGHYACGHVTRFWKTTFETKRLLSGMEAGDKAVTVTILEDFR